VSKFASNLLKSTLADNNTKFKNATQVKAKTCLRGAGIPRWHVVWRTTMGWGTCGPPAKCGPREHL